MRLIHTADIHLDACFAGAGMPPGFGNRRRQSLRDALHRICERAGDWPADALLIAGDLFEQERVSPDTVAFLCAEFTAIGHVPVFIAPGNHDPFVPDSPYASETWPDNVLIFSTPTWTSRSLPNAPLTVHGFGFDGPDISRNPFGELKIEEGDGIHVAVAHGSERGHQPPDQEAYAPFDAADAVVEGLAYLALGHIHRLTPVRTGSGTVMYYAGAPEGHGFGEPGLHYYLEVEVDAEGARVTPSPASGVVYTTHTIDCTALTTIHEIVAAVRALPREGSKEIARITLSGSCAPALSGELPVLFDALSEEFEFLDLADETHPAEDYDELAEENTSLGAFLLRINDEIRHAPDAARRRVAERAREVGVAAFRGRPLQVRGVERP